MSAKNTPAIRSFLVASALALSLPISAFAQQASAPAATDARPPMTHKADGQRGEHRHHHARGQRGHGEHAGGFMFGPGAMRDLNLTDAQRADMKKIFEEGREGRSQQREAMMKSRKELRDLIVSGKYTEQRGKELSATIATQQREQILAMAERSNRVVQLLTPEQRTKLAAAKPEGRRQHKR